VDGSAVTEEHHRTMSLYPAPFYLPQSTQYHTAGSSGSLLPTPGQQPYDLNTSSCKIRDYAKPGLGAALLHRSSGVCLKQYGAPGVQPINHVPSSGSHKYPRVSTPPTRLLQQHYGRRLAHPQPQVASTAYYFQQKPCQYGSASPRTGQRFLYGTQPTQLSAYAMHPLQKGFALTTTYEYAEAGRKGAESSVRQPSGRKSAILNSYRGSNLTIGTPMMRSTRIAEPIEVIVNSAPSVAAVVSSSPSSSLITASMTSTTGTSTITTIVTLTTTATTTATTVTATTNSDNNKSALIDPETKSTLLSSSSESPPLASYASVAHPFPNLSSPNPKQVQFFGSSGGNGSGGGGGGVQRYANNSSSNISQQQQHQLRSSNGNGSNGRYPTSSSMSVRGGKTSSVLRQPSTGSTKYKMNGIVQSSAGKMPIDEGNIGGAGDAPSVGRLPITPPGTPQETSGESDQHLNDACHHIQALNL
jgi:hypothetical protein